jgi:hypothetical protein
MARQLRAACEHFLHSQLPPSEHDSMLSASFKHLPTELGRSDGAGDPTTPLFGAGAFRILKVRSSLLAHALRIGYRRVISSGCAFSLRAVLVAR